eukprot:GHVR01037506.1.p1 GENE.GHVR01037506.1~~GHVR01037506.1.p1  ORF type:complete len:684 (+),score=144.07 GHVR01037506.1:1398-3449(+)
MCGKLKNIDHNNITKNNLFLIYKSVFNLRNSVKEYVDGGGCDYDSDDLVLEDDKLSIHKKWEIMTACALNLCINTTPNEDYIFIEMVHFFPELKSTLKRNELLFSTPYFFGLAFARGVNVFFGLKYIKKNKNDKEYIYIESVEHDIPTGLMMDGPTLYSSDEVFKWFEQQRDLIANVLMRIDIIHVLDHKNEKIKKGILIDRSDKVLFFMRELIKYTNINKVDNKEKLTYTGHTNLFLFDLLNEQCSTFWTSFFEGVHAVHLRDFTLKKEDTSDIDIYVSSSIDTTGICELILNTDELIITDFIQLNTFIALSPYSHKHWRDMGMKLKGVKDEPHKNENIYCHHVIADTFPMVLSKSNVQEESKRYQDDVSILEQYTRHLRSLMAQDMALHQSNRDMYIIYSSIYKSLIIDVGYPKYLEDPDVYLPLFYGDITNMNSNSFTSIISNQLTQKIRRQLSKEYALRESTLHNPISLTPVYYPYDNRLYVPLSLVYHVDKNIIKDCIEGSHIVQLAGSAGPLIVGGILEALKFEDDYFDDAYGEVVEDVEESVTAAFEYTENHYSYEFTRLHSIYKRTEDVIKLYYSLLASIYMFRENKLNVYECIDTLVEYFFYTHSNTYCTNTPLEDMKMNYGKHGDYSYLPEDLRYEVSVIHFPRYLKLHECLKKQQTTQKQKRKSEEETKKNN